VGFFAVETESHSLICYEASLSVRYFVTDVIIQLVHFLPEHAAKLADLGGQWLNFLLLWGYFTSEWGSLLSDYLLVLLFSYSGLCPSPNSFLLP